MSRYGRIGRDGWVYLQNEKCMAMSGFSYILKPLVCPGRAILSFLCKNRQYYGLVGPPLLPIKNLVCGHSLADSHAS